MPVGVKRIPIILDGIGTDFFQVDQARMLLRSDELHLMPLLAFNYGWLHFLNEAQIVALAQHLKPFDWLMRIGVIAFEGGCLFILWRRGLTRWLLAVGVLFHFLIFLLGGLLFWTWMALDVAVLILIFKRQRWPLVHTRVGFYFSLVLILGASWWARPPYLGWYITPLSYVYRIDATLANDSVVTLSPKFFTPYEDVFATASFAYTSRDHGVLVSTHGVTRDMQVVNGLRDAQTGQDVMALEDGRTRFNEQRTQTLYEFLVRFVGDVNRSGETLSWIQHFQPPLQNYAMPEGTELGGGIPIRQLAITEVTTFYNGESMQKIREVELTTLAISIEEDAPN